MFEKEAEEWAKENMDCVKTENCLNQDCNYFSDEERIIAKSAFEDGAEFAYNKANEELEEKIKVKKLEILELKSQIKKMKCDVIFLIKDRMNDDIDQNIIERLAEKWEIKEND